MAFQNPQGAQLDIQSVAAEIAADSTAIGYIATGVTSDPSASATLDLDYLRRDGTVAMTADLDVGANAIINVGNVDGRDVSADGSTLDSHVADATIHRVINDSGTLATELWSADKITTELGMKADIVSGAVNGNFAGLDASGNLTDSSYSSASFANIAGDTFTGGVTVNGELVAYKDNATCLRTKGPSSPNDPSAGADVQSYMGIFYNDAFAGTGNLRTRAIFGANIEMDLELQAPRQLRLIAVDDTQTDGQIYAASRNDVVINTRTLAETPSPNQLIIDRVDKGTVGAANTSNVEVSVNTGELEMASTVKFTAMPQLPVVAKASLSALGAGLATEAIGSTTFVSDDAGSPTFILAWVDGTNTWVRSDTGAAIS